MSILHCVWVWVCSVSGTARLDWFRFCLSQSVFLDLTDHFILLYISSDLVARSYRGTAVVRFGSLRRDVMAGPWWACIEAAVLTSHLRPAQIELPSRHWYSFWHTNSLSKCYYRALHRTGMLDSSSSLSSSSSPSSPPCSKDCLEQINLNGLLVAIKGPYNL
jgi:hypothetical protein